MTVELNKISELVAPNIVGHYRTIQIKNADKLKELELL